MRRLEKIRVRDLFYLESGAATYIYPNEIAYFKVDGKNAIDGCNVQNCVCKKPIYKELELKMSYEGVFFDDILQVISAYGELCGFTLIYDDETIDEYDVPINYSISYFGNQENVTIRIFEDTTREKL